MKPHLIFEGAELAGKSYLASGVYTKLEAQYAASKNILDGCVWINCDVGVFGTKQGPAMAEKYAEMAEILKERAVILEKLHVSDQVYRQMYGLAAADYTGPEKKLAELGFRIVLVTFREDLELVRKRLEDRMRLYPHYRRIAKEPEFYIKQQRLYREIIKRSTLPRLEADMTDLADRSGEILEWIRGGWNAV